LNQTTLPTNNRFFWNFANLLILVGKKIEKHCANSKKNVNNKEIAKILRSKIEIKNVIAN
jgi:hypothetical protein